MSQESFDPQRVRAELNALTSTFDALSLADLRSSGTRIAEAIERRLTPRWDQRTEIAAWLLRTPGDDPSTATTGELKFPVNEAALWAEELPTVLASMLIRAVHARNQFALLDSASNEVRACLADACAVLAEKLQTTDRLEALQPHLEPLVTGTLDRCFAVLEKASTSAIAPASLKREVICREYGSELQLELMGLEENTLFEPIVDLGCGPQAVLVRELRAREMDAVGVDRYIDVPATFAMQGDWMTFPLGESRWGTIISHQAFSLHFVHHHLASEEAAATYAKRYMQILRALRPGGRFVYTPGLPFFERLLPPAFSIKRVPLPPPLAEAMAAGLDRAIGESAAYTTHVLRG